MFSLEAIPVFNHNPERRPFRRACCRRRPSPALPPCHRLRRGDTAPAFYRVNGGEGHPFLKSQPFGRLPPPLSGSRHVTMGGRAASLSALTSARLRPVSSRTNSARLYQSTLNTQRSEGSGRRNCERIAQVRQGRCKQTARDDGGPGARTRPIPVSQCCQRGEFYCRLLQNLGSGRHFLRI